MPSDIHVFVRFKEQAVYAGEDVECTITFKNVAGIQLNPSPPAPKSGRHSRRVSLVEQAAQTPRVRSGGWGAESSRLAVPQHQGSWGESGRGHRPTSLSQVPTDSTQEDGQPATVKELRNAKPGHNHHRSVSIISLGSPDVDTHPISTPTLELPNRTRPSVGHKRASTVQLHSARPLSSRKESLSMISPALGAERTSPSFRFPSDGSQPTFGNGQARLPAQLNELRLDTILTSRNLQPVSRGGRQVSGPSIASSARSSGEFQSLGSNHSQETLVSEQPSLASERPRFPSGRIAQHYRMNSTPAFKRPETATLLMGYAQVNATFTLDGSLVDQSPFEAVKRKGFLGGQAGGGVVGVKTPEATGKYFGGLTLNSIGDSFSGLLGGGDISSTKEMRHVTTSRAIPLLSTPQSLLFVDLQLVPGAEKSFSFKYTIPAGLPSSHRGKALKVVYNLVIGVQGAPGEKDVQAVRQVNVPIRVFSGVHSDGEVLGHDLMQPYVVLKDLARTKSVENTPNAQTKSDTSGSGSTMSEKDFLTFVDNILDMNHRRQSSTGTMDPTLSATTSKETSRTKQAIDRAIALSNQTAVDSDRSPNRFEIARNGSHIAVIILNRTSHRSGESVLATVEFEDSGSKCFSVHATLETTEHVNPGLAARSAASIARVTRRVYASQSENVLFARRVVFSPFIPATATPSLTTSGVTLAWALRFEFSPVTKTSASEPEDEQEVQKPRLLEDIVQDERGTIQAAAESIECEAFEVSIPLTVYGDIVTDGLDQDEVIGLPV